MRKHMKWAKRLVVGLCVAKDCINGCVLLKKIQAGVDALVEHTDR